MVQLLIWAPVVLLPLANLLSAVNSGVSFDFSQRALWVFGAVAEELFYRFFLLKKLLLVSRKLTLCIRMKLFMLVILPIELLIREVVNFQLNIFK